LRRPTYSVNENWDNVPLAVIEREVEEPYP